MRGGGRSSRRAQRLALRCWFKSSRLHHTPLPSTPSEAGSATNLEVSSLTKRLHIPWAGRLVLTLPYMALVVILSVTPDDPNPGDSVFGWLVHTTPSLLQKFLHVCAYATLAAAWSWTLAPLMSMRGRLIVAFATSVGFGALLEWLQTFVPGRFGSLYDILLNAMGALVGTLAAYAWLSTTTEASLGTGHGGRKPQSSSPVDSAEASTQE